LQCGRVELSLRRAGCTPLQPEFFGVPIGRTLALLGRATGGGAGRKGGPAAGVCSPWARVLWGWFVLLWFGHAAKLSGLLRAASSHRTMVLGRKGGAAAQSLSAWGVPGVLDWGGLRLGCVAATSVPGCKLVHCTTTARQHADPKAPATCPHQG
jgi:hypothetical protein